MFEGIDHSDTLAFAKNLLRGLWAPQPCGAKDPCVQVVVPAAVEPGQNDSQFAPHYVAAGRNKPGQGDDPSRHTHRLIGPCLGVEPC